MFSYSYQIGAITDEKLFAPTGDIGRWIRRVETRLTANAVKAAPSSLASGRPNKSRANAAYPSGSMKLSIRGSLQQFAIREFIVTVSVNVPYAIYVLKGTGPIIYSTSARIPAGQAGGGQFAPLGRSRGMYLPGNPGYKARRRQRVRGQRANNFLADAFDATARLHPSLSGYSME